MTVPVVNGDDRLTERGNSYQARQGDHVSLLPTLSVVGM